MTRKARFYSLEDMLKHTAKNGECLEWTEGINGSGHGKAWNPHTHNAVDAHRLAYEYAHNVSLKPEEFVCHSCDNPPCINPDHLWLGKASDNNMDKTVKGRAALVLTVEDVKSIRRNFTRTSPRKSNSSELAKRYGVTRTTINAIVTGASWSWL